MKRIPAALGAVLLTIATVAPAQNWPTKPITFLNPFPAGGGTDTFARPIAAYVSQTIGQQVIVENQGGAGGTVGTLGSTGLRATLVTASGISLPALICTDEVPMPSKARSTCPASRSTISGPAPL